MNYPWLYYRGKLIFLIFIEVFIYILLIENSPQEIKSYNFIFLSFYFFLYFIISYVFGRYSLFYKQNSKGLLYTIKKNLFSTFYTTLFLNIILIVLNNIFYQNLPAINFIIFSLIFLGICSISQLFINIILLKRQKKLFRWIYVGDLESYKILKKEMIFVKRDFILEQVNQIDFSKIREEYLNKFAGMIFERKEDFEEIYPIDFLKLYNYGIEILTKTNFCEKYLERIPPQILDNYSFLTKNFAYLKFGSTRLRFKRVGDFIFSLILLTLTSPLILIFGFFIYLQDQGPIFYKQKRTGLNGKTFFIYKLRSMKINSELKGPQWSSINDKRITFIGKFIRLTRIDELPQLLAVIRGEMSLIGPRPERPEFDMVLKKEIPYYYLRYYVRPGLSGWAQVNYPYGASIDDAKNKLSYDLFYICNYSNWLDFLILFKTIKTVINGKLSLPKFENK